MGGREPRHRSIEEVVTTTTIQTVHSSTHRLADSAQREIRVYVREGVLQTETTFDTVEWETVKESVEWFDAEIRSRVPAENPGDRREIIRTGIVKEILSTFQGVWPFTKVKS